MRAHLVLLPFVVLACTPEPPTAFVPTAPGGSSASPTPRKIGAKPADGKCWTSAECDEGQVCKPPHTPPGGEPARGVCEHYDPPSGPSQVSCKGDADCRHGEQCVGVPCVVAPCPSYCTKL